MRILFFLLLLVVVPSVSAVGFVNLPSQREFLFSPGAEFSVPITVANGQNIYTYVDYPLGNTKETLGTPEDDNIANYVGLNDPDQGGGMRKVMIEFSLPSQMKPGVYHIDLYAQDKPGGMQGTVSAVAVAKIRLKLRVLSPTKLLEIQSFVVSPIAEGLEANASLNVISRTTQDIRNIVATFDVFGNGTTIGSGKSRRISLESAGTASLLGQLPTTDLLGGDYYVNVTVVYDGKSVLAGPKVLQIGTLHVNVTNYSKTLLYNATNKFEFTIQNQWNRELRNVYAFVVINGQEKKTASLNVPPFGEKSYEVYFDRDESLEPGQTEANITITFKDFYPASQEYVDKEESFFRMIEISIPAIEEKPFPTAVVLSTVVVLIFIIALVLFFVFRKKPEQPEQPEEHHEPQTPPSY